jgi:DNA-binding NarL/FixJ family response regulator
MPTKEIRCAILADRHLGLAERVRDILETEFEAVVVVGDEISLFESTRQLDVAVAVVELSLPHGDGLGLIRRIRDRFPQLKLIALSVHPEAYKVGGDCSRSEWICPQRIHRHGSAPHRRRGACGSAT